MAEGGAAGNRETNGGAGAGEPGVGGGSMSAAGIGGESENSAGAGGFAGAGTEPVIPADLRDFVTAVAAAATKAQNDGSLNCARAIPAVPVASLDEAWARAREYVARVSGVKLAALQEDATTCNQPSSAKCAALFQNDVYHSDGRMGDALYPLAQQVDAATSADRVVIFVPHQGNLSLPAVVVTAGVKDGFVMAIAFFNGRSKCE